jgi:hypothetical protein
MGAKSLIDRLVKIRGIHLERETYRLRSKVDARCSLERAENSAQTIARQVLEEAKVLSDLAILGEARIKNARCASILSREIASTSQRVKQIYYRYVAAQKLQRALALREDRAREDKLDRESEQFLGWRRTRCRESH